MCNYFLFKHSGVVSCFRQLYMQKSFLVFSFRMMLLKYEANRYLHSVNYLIFKVSWGTCVWCAEWKWVFNHMVVLKKVIKAFSHFYNKAIFKQLSGFNLHIIKPFSQNLQKRKKIYHSSVYLGTHTLTHTHIFRKSIYVFNFQGQLYESVSTNW